LMHVIKDDGVVQTSFGINQHPEGHCRIENSAG